MAKWLLENKITLTGTLRKNKREIPPEFLPYRKKRPEIITFYNSTKGGVDTCDQLCSNYNVGRRTKRWPLAIFNHFINVSAVNSYIIFKSNTKEKIKRRIFLKNLAKSLTLDHIIRRGNDLHILRSLRQKIWIYLGNQGINKEQVKVTDEVDNNKGF